MKLESSCVLSGSILYPTARSTDALNKPGSRHTGCFNVPDSEQSRQKNDRAMHTRHHDCQEHSVMAAVRLSSPRP